MAEKKPYVVYWTHDDGMDQHEIVAMLTAEQAEEIEAQLYELGALDYGVTDVLASAETYDDVKDAIREDLMA